MALVKISEYIGSKVGLMSLMYMNEIELTQYLRSFGYTIQVFPDMQKAKVGYIEDSPDSHRINITKKVGVPLDLSDKQIIEKYSKDNMNIKPIFGYENTRKNNVSFDKDTNTKWYSDEIEIRVKRNINESNDEYALRITSIAFNILKRDGGN